MTTDTEKLAQIAALCDEMAQSRGGARHAADELRAILAEPGPAVPPHGVDREALEPTLLRNGPTTWDELDAHVMADHVLALVRPVEGVTLTPEEASACYWALDHLVAKHAYDALRGQDGSRVDLRALAARLEAPA